MKIAIPTSCGAGWQGEGRNTSALNVFAISQIPFVFCSTSSEGFLRDIFLLSLGSESDHRCRRCCNCKTDLLHVFVS